MEIEDFHDLKVGSLVLARYEEDQEIYRAKVEKIVEEHGKRKVQVRFIDYGNSSQLGLESLFPWEKRYEVIRPQAVHCRMQLFSGQELREEESEEFRSVMRSLGPLSMKVHRVSAGDKEDVKLVVSLYHDGRDVLKDLPLLAGHFSEESVYQLSDLSNSVQLCSSVAIEALSAREKVEGWLQDREKERRENKISGKGNSRTDSGKERGKKEIKERSYKKDGQTSGKEERKSPEPEPVEKVFTFPSEDIRPQYEGKADTFVPPLASKSRLNANLGDQFSVTLSHVESPDEIYIATDRLIQTITWLDEELNNKRIETPAKVQEVKIGTVWMWNLSNDQYERVEVVKINHEAATVEVQLLDSGAHQGQIEISQLLRVPDGLARNLPGLVVRCHLSGIEATPEATLIVRKLLPLYRRFSAKVTDLSSQDSCGLEFIMDGEVMNKVLVEENLAVPILPKPGQVKENMASLTQQGVQSDRNKSLENDKNLSGSISLEEWDPMAEDYDDLDNNYRARDDDLEFVHSRYQSRQAVCPFYLKTGHCYKGEMCEERHTRLRHGAVTTDLLDVANTIETLDQPIIPTLGTTVRVHITHINSPTSFYVTFPHGDTNILTLTDEAKKYSVISSKYLELHSSMQESYRLKSRVLIPTSLPAPNTMVAVKVSGEWLRALVMDFVDSQNNLEVFLIDSGRVETVGLEDVRRLQDTFTILPCQALQAELSLVEPQNGGWTSEAALTMERLAGSADYMAGRVVMVSANKQLVMEIWSVKGEVEVDLCEELCQLGQAVKVTSSVKKRPSNVCPG